MNDAAPAIDRLPTSHRGWYHLLAESGVRPSKGLGQHFLVERGIVQRIVRTAGVGPGHRILEIGPGFGILTQVLLASGADLIAIEVDLRLAAHLRRTFGDLDRLDLIEGDALTIDLNTWAADHAPFSVVANLPYSAGTAILMRLLELATPPELLTVMVQREVAERLCAEPPEMTVLSVAAQLLSRPRVAFVVAPTVFLPPPKVESAVVVLAPRGEERLPIAARAAFFELVKGGFRHKRKQVANSLAMELDIAKPEATALLTRAGIDPLRRAETLGVDEWLTLHRHRQSLS